MLFCFLVVFSLWENTSSWWSLWKKSAKSVMSHSLSQQHSNTVVFTFGRNKYPLASWFDFQIFVKDALVLNFSHPLRNCLRRFTVISSLMWYSKVHHALFPYLKRCIYLSCCQRCAQAFHMYIIESVARCRNIWNRTEYHYNFEVY